VRLRRRVLDSGKLRKPKVSVSFFRPVSHQHLPVLHLYKHRTSRPLTRSLFRTNSPANLSSCTRSHNDRGTDNPPSQIECDLPVGRAGCQWLGHARLCPRRERLLHRLTSWLVPFFQIGCPRCYAIAGRAVVEKKNVYRRVTLKNTAHPCQNL
jgi:hypothetical protein